MKIRSCIETFAVLLMIPGVLLVCIALVWWQVTDRSIRVSKHTEGTVTELAESRSSQGSVSYSPVIEFTDHREQLRKYQPNLKTNPPMYSVGDKVPILYGGKLGDSVKINHWFYLYLWSLVLGVIGAVDLLFVAFLFFVIRLIFGRAKPKQQQPECSAMTAGGER